jgi:FkbM family methyltransferase
MLISGDEVKHILSQFGVKVDGVLHVGAHECEEMPFYESLGLKDIDVVWVDALQFKVDEAKARGVKNMYQAVVTDKDDTEVEFKITDNVQSSSIFDFGTHAQNHSHVHVVGSVKLRTTTLRTFCGSNNIDTHKHNFWNMDIQGAELFALQGAEDLLQHVKALYLEVNTEEVYKGCGKLWQIDELVAKYGFTRVRTEMTHCGWGDALYVKTKVITIEKMSLCIPTMDRWSFLQKYIPLYLENPFIDEIVICDENGNDAKLIGEHINNPRVKVHVNTEIGPFF